MLSLTQILKILCFAIFVCAWISFLCGAILRNSFGVEALFVVQFAWMTFLWNDTPLIFSFYSMIPLKYSLGYNLSHSIPKKSQNALPKLLFTERSEMSDSVFINNFAFCFLLLCLSFMFSVIFGVIYKLSKQNTQNLFRNIKQKLVSK